ncbi:MAG: helix-turn-helix domain-containing protein [Flavobacteriaceae bacterium]|nr:helix-turn-helix domain-containing protein [Flavobacteriaceae bacterium]
MDKNFIDKVHNIVMSNITDEKFGVSELASLIGLSTSQTLKKVKAKTGKSVNQYIRELRLKEAATLIKETDLTIAEIAYKVGFGSQSYFNKTFRRRYGITPGEYKTHNKEAIENIIDQAPKQKGSKSQKIILFSILILAMLIIGYLIIDKSQYQKINDRPPSIAILPFKNISNDTENQYLADGIWDDLLNHLSTIKGLIVISRQSTERYRESKKSMPAIGKELGVGYIVESSIQKFENKLRIITQLIDVKSDKHLWSHEYDYELKDVFKIQCETAKRITQKLNVILTDKEEKVLEKHPTENMEAYHLFLKGRLKNNSRKKEDLELNIKLNKEAVVLDPEFADAYAEIGNSYLLMGVYDYLNLYEALNKGNFYSNKALKINPNCFRACSVKARLLQHKDWAKSKEFHELAITSNPNDAAAHLQFGRYYLFCPNPDVTKFLHYLTIAQRLDPFSKVVGGNFLNALIVNNKIKETEKYFNKMKFLWSKEDNLRTESLIKAYKNKDWKEAIRFFEMEIEKDPNNSYLYNQLGHAYDEILNDNINFLKYAKIAYELDSTNSSNVSLYHSALVESKNFATAKKLMQSQNFKSLHNEKQQLNYLWYYYYHQENYEKAQEVLKDSLMEDNIFYKVITYAQLGDREKVDDIFKDILNINSKVFVYAILKERDSMYHYLGKLIEPGRIRRHKSRREFDPYRKEERFKAFLKKNYLPITHWNE